MIQNRYEILNMFREVYPIPEKFFIEILGWTQILIKAYRNIPLNEYVPQETDYFESMIFDFDSLATNMNTHTRINWTEEEGTFADVRNLALRNLRREQRSQATLQWMNKEKTNSNIQEWRSIFMTAKFFRTILHTSAILDLIENSFPKFYQLVLVAQNIFETLTEGISLESYLQTGLASLNQQTKMNEAEIEIHQASSNKVLTVGFEIYSIFVEKGEPSYSPSTPVTSYVNL